jgi:hypothetical protein
MTGRKTDSHDGAKSLFLQFCEGTLKQHIRQGKLRDLNFLFSAGLLDRNGLHFRGNAMGYKTNGLERSQKLRKVSISFVMSVCLSVRPYA